MHSAPKKTVAAVAAAALLVSLAGCGSVGQHEWTFDTAKAATASGDAGRFPGFLPADATDVVLQDGPSGQPGAQLAFTSKAGVTADYCEPGALPAFAAEPADWWPATAPAEGLDCGWWKVFTDGGRTYAWDARRG